MSGARRSIYRGEALAHYVRWKEKDVLPRVIAPPVFLFLWALLGLCLFALALAWFGQVPVYVTGAGVVVDPVRGQGVQETGVLIFLPADPANPLHIVVGSPVDIQIGALTRPVNAIVDRVEPGVFSPDDARQRFQLGSQISQLITGPAIAIFARLGPAFPIRLYVGSSVKAQVQIGSRRILSLLS